MCNCQPHCEEDMLCVAASFMMKNISYVLYAVSYCQPHCEEDMAVFFYKCVYQKECIWCQVHDMLPIKIFFKKS